MRKRARAGETSAETSGPVLVPQPHGGALQRGNPGNRGGMGAAPSAVRAICRESFAKRVPVLEQIADSEEAPPAERIKAVRELGRYAGLGEETGDIMSHPDARRFLAAIHSAVDGAVRQYAPREADRILAAIERALSGGLESADEVAA